MKRMISGMLAAALLLTGCAAPRETAGPEEAWAAEEIGSFEAETGVFTGNVRVEQGYATGFTADGDSCAVTVEVPENGFYDLEFLLRAEGGYKENYVNLDSLRLGTVSADGQGFQRSRLRRVYMEAGSHTVALEKYWGYMDFDKVILLTSQPFDETVFDIPARLVNENATDNARRLFSYLCDSYGEYILSGQYCDTGMSGWENRMIADNNGGKYPAILGLDVGYYSQTGIDHGAEISTTEQAIAYWEKGGIVTLCWHWLAPEKYITGTWYSAFRPEEINMNLTKIVNGEDAEGLALLKKDIDNVAQQLLKMQEAGVPILWRPLHEASGGWFWWGAEGADTYKKLYLLLYDTLTKEYGLNNLIWLWNGQDPEWYPGDAYVDIIGTDIYAGEHVYSPQTEQFLKNLECGNGRKLVVLSENGTLIDPEMAVRDRAMWGFFCTWGGEFVMTDGLKKSYSQQYTDTDMLTKVYSSEYVITRDELPDLHSYPIRDDAQ